MTASHSIAFGPRLIGTPTGTLRAALLVKPSRGIERAAPLIGEPGAIYERALEQHAILCKTLRYFGVETIVLEPCGDDPYETAATDAAVALEDGAVLMRPSAMPRRTEVERMRDEFGRVDVPLAGEIVAPGMLDGSDVLLAGQTAFVGVGARANAQGRAGFSGVAQAHGYRTVEVALAPGVPSLRSVAGLVAKRTVLLAADKLDASAFSEFEIIAVERGDENGAGVLCLSDHHAIADLRYLSVTPALRRAGITVEAIDLYEFAKLGITPSMMALALKRD